MSLCLIPARQNGGGWRALRGKTDVADDHACKMLIQSIWWHRNIASPARPNGGGWRPRLQNVVQSISEQKEDIIDFVLCSYVLFLCSLLCVLTFTTKVIYYRRCFVFLSFVFVLIVLCSYVYNNFMSTLMCLYFPDVAYCMRWSWSFNIILDAIN